MGCGIMFPRDYILDREAEGFGCSVEGFDGLCEPVESGAGELLSPVFKGEPPVSGGSAHHFHVCSVLRQVG